MASHGFSQLIKLIHTAEQRLIQAGQTDPLLRITTLRGIYYGTEWSSDYHKEESRWRNRGFWTFTGGQSPEDPRPILGTDLFRRLQANQDAVRGAYRVDIGHILIGLDARKRPVSRSKLIPSMGGTGLEISTWLGDLGGGAANLAVQRVKNPQISVASIFRRMGSDYGASSNMEGDIGGYLIAADASNIPGEPIFPRGTGIAGALERYLPVSGPTREWNSRAVRFARALGANIGRGHLIHAPDFSALLASKIEDWSTWYLAQRYILPGKLKPEEITITCRYLASTASETATVFVRALARAIENPGSPLAAHAPFPKPSVPRTSCSSELLKSVVTGRNISEFFDEASKQIVEFLSDF